MPNVQMFMNCYFASASVAGALFFLKSCDRILRVGIIRYVCVLTVAAVAWPFFISRNYF